MCVCVSACSASMQMVSFHLICKEEEKMTCREKGGEHGLLQRRLQAEDKKRQLEQGAAKGEAWAGRPCECVCVSLLEGGRVSQYAEGEGKLLQVSESERRGDREEHTEAGGEAGSSAEMYFFPSEPAS